MSLSWLSTLEARVHEATDRLQALREENESLTQRIAELESQLAEATSGDADAEAWQAERATIRERVEGLASHLESLLSDSED